MGLLSFLKSGKNPAQPAMPYLNQVPGVYRDQLNPYIQPGLQASQANQSRYSQLASNPASVHDELMSSYTPSKGFQLNMQEAQRLLNNQAPFLGGPRSDSFARTQADTITRLLMEGSKDYYNDLVNLMGMGLQGQEFGAQRGFGASTALADALGTNLGNQASLAFRGQQEKNAQRAQRQAMIGQLAGMLGGNFLGTLAGGGNTPGQYSQQGGFSSSPYAQQYHNQMFGKGLPGL